MLPDLERLCRVLACIRIDRRTKGHSLPPAEFVARLFGTKTIGRYERPLDNLLNVAIQQLRAARSALANPATLPPSFRS